MLRTAAQDTQEQVMGTNNTNGDITTKEQGPRGSTETRPNGRATGPVAGTTRSLPEAFMDERDDVLTVINELEDQLDRYEEIREALERELRDAQEQNRAAKQRAQELEWQVVTLQTRVEALEQVRQEVTHLEEEIADSNIRVQRITEQLTRAEKDNSRLTSELKAANKQLEELWAVRKERDGLRVDTKNIRAKLEQLEMGQREWQDERTALHTRLQETSAALEETRAARHAAELALRASEERGGELKRTNEALTEKIDAILNDKKAQQAQLAHLERENTRLHEQQKFSECELTTLRSMNRSAETALANVKKAFAEVRVALAETKSRARRRTIEHWPRVPGGRPDDTTTESDQTSDIQQTV